MCRFLLDRLLLLSSLVFLAGSISAPAANALPWSGGSETSISITGASSDLSGATWNSVSQSLWVVRQNRQVWEYAYDSGAGSYELLQTFVLPFGVGTDIEAIAQVDHSAVDELYTLDEDDRRIALTVDIFGTPTVLRTWNLGLPSNGNVLPPETSGNGPEGLEFVPDADLVAAGFRFPNGSAFGGSTKGMGGLLFVGHQIAGRLHVFDVNPDVSGDFINHGSFLTSASEIAALHYDRPSGLMYIWHNPSNVNSLEVTSLSSNEVMGTVDTLEHFDTSMPSGNLEGLAIVGRSFCGEFGSADADRSLFLTRDGGSSNLVNFDAFSCSCLGSQNEAEFDACFDRGNLGGGCSCLDEDVDGDVDCDDFAPPISMQCSEPAPVPALSGWHLFALMLSMLMVSTAFARKRRI